MRKTLTILSILVAQYVCAQTTHYISTTGSDANSGTIGSPWKTLSYACSQVSTIGDIIYVNSGSYTETQPALLAVGVNLDGAGRDLSFIHCHYTTTTVHNDYPTNGSLNLSSSTEGTNGNQSISNITFDGDNLMAVNCIYIKCRSNVIIHDLRIKDFYVNGIFLNGCSVNPETRPVTLSTGNKIYNIIIDNCTDSDATWVGQGLMNLVGQKDWDISGTFSDTSRAEGRNGDIMINNRFGLGGRFHNSTCYKPSTSNALWNFHLEIPWGEGGTEIDSNFFYGGDNGVDIGGNGTYNKSYSYLFHIHHNYFEDTNPTQDGSYGKTCLAIEGAWVKNVFMDHNTFKNIVRPFGLTDGTPSGTSSHDTNVVFSNNVCMNVGINASGTFQFLVEINKNEAGGSIIGLSVINNTIIPNSVTSTSCFSITNHNGSVMKSLLFGNNIIERCTNGAWLNVDNTGGTIDSLTVNTNILHNNANSNSPTFSGNAVTHYTNTGNINSDPLLTSPTDYTLQSGSPAIGVAFLYGYGSDIGALQYTTTAAPTISISSDQTITVDNTSVSAVAGWASGHSGTYHWSKISGPGTTSFGNVNSASTTVTGLQTGTYVIRCTVTQDDGQTTFAEVTIHVTIPNIPPVANAGSDQTITLPTNSVTLIGSGTDTDGTIVSYGWSVVSGGSVTFTAPTSATTNVTGLTSGVHVLRLTVTDNNSATGTDDVTITVNIAPVPVITTKLEFKLPYKFKNQ